MEGREGAEGAGDGAFAEARRWVEVSQAGPGRGFPEGSFYLSPPPGGGEVRPEGAKLRYNLYVVQTAWD